VWQQHLDSLASLLGNPVATIDTVIGQLNSYVGAVPSQVQSALNSVAQIVGQTPAGRFVNHTVDEVAQYLTQFQPLITTLANALGIPALDQTISNIATQLDSWATSITASMQNNIDSVAQQLGLPGLGNTTASVADQLNNLQPELQNLADLLGQNPISAVISLLGAFGGNVTTEIQGAIDAVAGALGLAAGLTVSELQSNLSTLQSDLDAVASASGLSGTGHTINGVIAAVVQFIGQPVGSTLQSAIDAVVNFLGTTGTGHTVLTLLDTLLGLLGNLFSGYTTDAQLFISIQPLLELGGL